MSNIVFGELSDLWRGDLAKAWQGVGVIPSMGKSDPLLMLLLLMLGFPSDTEPASAVWKIKKISGIFQLFLELHTTSVSLPRNANDATAAEKHTFVDTVNILTAKNDFTSE